MPTTLDNPNDTTFALQLALSSATYKFVLEACLEVVYLQTRVPEARHLHKCVISKLQQCAGGKGQQNQVPGCHVLTELLPCNSITSFLKLVEQLCMYQVDLTCWWRLNFQSRQMLNRYAVVRVALHAQRLTFKQLDAV